MLNITMHPTRASIQCPTNGILTNPDATYQAEIIDYKNRRQSTSVEDP